MGRSTDYLSRAVHVVFTDVSHFGYRNECDEDGNEIPNTTYFDEDQSSFDWDDFKTNIIFTLQAKFPSLEEVTDRWDGRETKIILENNFCEIGLSEYGGLASISIRINEDIEAKTGLAERWIKRVWKKMQTEINDMYPLLVKQGSFSNGEGVYAKINAPAQGVCHNGMGITYAW